MLVTPILEKISDFDLLSSLTPAWLQAIAAFLGLLFVGRQIGLARKSSDLQNLMQFVENFRQHEHRLLLSTSSEEKDAAFVDLLNLMETWAAAYNEKLLGGASRRIAKLKLRDALAQIQASTDWGEKLVGAMSSEDTFAEIHAFYKKNKTAINTISNAHRK